jgi:hypothetical protein
MPSTILTHIGANLVHNINVYMNMYVYIKSTAKERLATAWFPGSARHIKTDAHFFDAKRWNRFSEKFIERDLLK